MPIKKKPQVKDEKKAPVKTGRPTIYNEEIAEKICDVIATTDWGLETVCKSSDDFPSYHAAVQWLLKADHPFTEKYARAKEQQAEVLGDQIIQISDDCKPDSKFAVEKAKLQVDARKFVASKLKPKKWGDKLIKEVVGADGGPIKIESQDIDLSPLNDEELVMYRALNEKLAKKNSGQDK